MASTAMVASRAGTPLPPTATVGESSGPAPSGASGALPAMGAPPTPDLIAPVAGVLVNKNPIKYSTTK
jgi:hypothetical protein